MKTLIIILCATMAIVLLGCVRGESANEQSGNLPIILSATLAGGADWAASKVQSRDNLMSHHKMVVNNGGGIIGTPTQQVPPRASHVPIYSYSYQSGDATADALGVLVGIRTNQTDFSTVKRSDLSAGSKLYTSSTVSAQTLSGDCGVVDFVGDDTYIYNANIGIDLAQRVVNTFRMSVNENGAVGLGGAELRLEI